MAALLFTASVLLTFLGVAFAAAAGRATALKDRDEAKGTAILTLIAMAAALILALVAGLIFGGA